jgi:hypothetical protein
MAAPVGNFYPVGLQHARFYPLDSYGLPTSSEGDGVAYDGVEIIGPNTFDVTPAKSRDVVATGNDRRLSQDKLPSLEVSGAVLKTSRLDFAVLALLTGTKVATLGESLLVGFNSDKQGQEPAIGMLLYQKGKIAGSGARAYGAYQMPSACAVIDPASMGGSNPAEYAFNIVPSAVSHYLFGLPFDIDVEGYTESEVQWSLTYGRPHITVWMSGAATVEFPFTPALAPASTEKIHRVVVVDPSDGTVDDVTSTVDISDPDLVDFTSLGTPGDGFTVIAFSEF